MHFKLKTTNVTPFHAHFERKLNTPLSKNNTIPNSTILTYEQNWNHYLDADTVPVNGYLDDNGWISAERSDIMVEEPMTRAQTDACR